MDQSKLLEQQWSIPTKLRPKPFSWCMLSEIKPLLSFLPHTVSFAHSMIFLCRDLNLAIFDQYVKYLGEFSVSNVFGKSHPYSVITIKRLW